MYDVQIILKKVVDDNLRDCLKTIVYKELSKELKARCSGTRIYSLDNYIKTNIHKNLNVYDIIEFAISNLVFNCQNNTLTFSINECLNIPNTQISLGSLINLITYGNLEIRGCDIVEKIFTRFEMRGLIYGN